MPASASAGRSRSGRYFTAASTSISVPIFSRTATRSRRTLSASIARDDARLAAGNAVVAAVGEVQVGLAARAVVVVLHVRDAGGGQSRRDHHAEVEHAAGSRALHVRERLEHLLAHLVA